MTEVVIGLSLSQRPSGGLNPKDIDDCWVVESLQAARACGADIRGIDIPAFRKAAGRPDNPNKPNPGGAADVIKGLNKLFPKLRVSQSSTNWDTYRAGLTKQGKMSVLLVLSDKLDPEHQYGFSGPRSWHAIAGRYVGTYPHGFWAFVNPMQPEGTRAQRYTERELKAAALAYPGGVQAVWVLPEKTAPAPIPPGPIPVPPVDPTPYSQDDLDDAREEGRVAGIQAVIEAAEGLI